MGKEYRKHGVGMFAVFLALPIPKRLKCVFITKCSFPLLPHTPGLNLRERIVCVK